MSFLSVVGVDVCPGSHPRFSEDSYQRWYTGPMQAPLAGCLFVGPRLDAGSTRWMSFYRPMQAPLAGCLFIDCRRPGASSTRWMSFYRTMRTEYDANSSRLLEDEGRVQIVRCVGRCSSSVWPEDSSQPSPAVDASSTRLMSVIDGPT